jgi:hypothetical protein
MKSPIPKERLRVSNWIVQRLYSYAVNVPPVGIDESQLGRYSNREEDQEATVARDGHAFVAERISAKCRGMGLAGATPARLSWRMMASIPGHSRLTWGHRNIQNTPLGPDRFKGFWRD